MSLILAIDFDATLAEHQFPRIGPEVPEAINWCKVFQKLDAKLILWTVRQDGPKMGDVRTAAVNWCKDRGLVFDAVNNDLAVYQFDQGNKIYAHIYIDDAALGCPVIWTPSGARVVDWSKVGPMVVERLAAGL